MSDIPDTVDVAQDFVTEVVEIEEEKEKRPRWHRHVAVTTLILALLTALGAMLAGMSANHSLMERTREIIEVNALEADRVNIEILKSKHEILAAMGEFPNKSEVDSINRFESEMLELKEDTVVDEMNVQLEVEVHNIYAIAVTLLSLGTALCGMAIIVNRKALWYWSLLFGVFGIAGLAAGLLRMYL